MLRPKNIIPHDQIEEIRGFHARSMLGMAAIGVSCAAPAVICHFILGIEANWWMGAPVFLAPVLFLVLALWRSLHAHCPQCQDQMKRGDIVHVIEPLMIMGKYNCTPWTVFNCPSCNQQWRVPAIKLGEGAHRITEEERQRIVDQQDS